MFKNWFALPLLGNAEGKIFIVNHIVNDGVFRNGGGSLFLLLALCSGGGSPRSWSPALARLRLGAGRLWNAKQWNKLALRQRR